MSFFQKDQTQKNLQYDDIAFLHFLLTICFTSTVVFGYLVFKRLKQANIKNIKNYKKIKETGLFSQQIQNQAKKLKKEKITIVFFIMIGILLVSLITSVVVAFFITNHTTQLIGFDPHQILGISSDATVSQIKKSYRKLALIYHPDRNPNDPQAHAKFIMISKSYQCLTDQQKKLNCQKYGNPDGQTSFQVGIGLPKFMVSKESQFIVLPIVFFILLFVIPMVILKWANSLKARDNYGLDITNYPALYPFYRPEFNASFGFYLLTALKQLQSDKKITQKQKNQFFSFLTSKRIIDVNYVAEHMNQSQLYVLHSLFQRMALKEKDLELCKTVPQLLDSLIKFSCCFARRINDKKFLFNDTLPINWIGTQHIQMLLQFTRTFYNCSLFNPPIFLPLDYLDIPKQDHQISFKNPIENFRSMLMNKDKIKQHLSLFPEHHRQQIKKQINDMPILQLQLKCKLGEEDVNKFTTQDFPQICFKVIKKNQTSGYCYMKNYPYLKQQKYYFMLVYQNNLLHFEQITFEQGSNEYVGKFPYRQSVARQMKFMGFIRSDCRYGLDTNSQISFNVVEPRQQQAQQQIQFHEQDMTIQKQPKGYLQKMLSLQVQNPSDVQLSDTEDQSPNEKKKNEKSGSRMQEQKEGGNEQQGKQKKSSQKKKKSQPYKKECGDGCCH